MSGLDDLDDLEEGFLHLGDAALPAQFVDAPRVVSASGSPGSPLEEATAAPQQPGGWRCLDASHGGECSRCVPNFSVRPQPRPRGGPSSVANPGAVNETQETHGSPRQLGCRWGVISQGDIGFSLEQLVGARSTEMAFLGFFTRLSPEYAPCAPQYPGVCHLQDERRKTNSSFSGTGA